MDQRLGQVAQAGDIEAFYDLVRTKPYILERNDRIPFVETPLHVAASFGHTEFAMEMMRLKPSFARKPNQDGFTPIHLALQNQNINQQHKLVLALLKVDPDLVRLKGKEGETPLHYAARNGNLHLLAKFLVVCPDSIKDVTIRSETALHIALKYNMVEAFEVLLGWLHRAAYDKTPGLKETILNSENNEGNTVLHMATSNINLPQVVRATVVRALLGSGVAVNKKNLSGLTALDILESQRSSLDYQEIEDMLRRARALRAAAVDTASITFADYLRSKVSFIESVEKNVFCATLSMPNGKRNAFLVVAVLIATATYQAALFPPGGVWQDDYKPSPGLNTTTITPSSSSSPPSHHAGKAVLSWSDLFLFYTFNSLVFCSSISIICFLLPLGLYGLLLRSVILYLYICHSASLFLISDSVVNGVVFFVMFVISSSLVQYVYVCVFVLLPRKGLGHCLIRDTARRFGTLPDLVPRKRKSPWLLLY